MKRGEPSHRPGGLAPRGLCDFYCPQQNAAGNELGRSYADSGRLYCRYDVEEADDKEFCMYKRASLQLQKKNRDAYLSLADYQNTGELVSSSSPSQCDEQAVFHCPGTKNGQQEMKRIPGGTKTSRSVNLPQFVKARSMARKAMEADPI
jgi:hypothetical protein